MNHLRAGRRRPASLALLVIVLITAAWWALALWPAGAVEPEWLIRTRAACFGSSPGGLPDLGGWILLIGQPLGMGAILLLVWGRELQAELGMMRRDRRWQIVLVGIPVLSALGLLAVGRRVAYAAGIGAPEAVIPAGVAQVVDIDLSTIRLTDQYGRRVGFAGLGPGPTLLTFAFGHCGTICPTVVHDVLRARSSVGRPGIPLLVVTLDPWRDTPERLAPLARQWQIAGNDLVLSGSIAEVEQLLDHVKVGRRRDPTTGDIDHIATVMLLDDRGHIVSRLEGGWGQVDLLLDTFPVPEVDGRTVPIDDSG